MAFHTLNRRAVLILAAGIAVGAILALRGALRLPWHTYTYNLLPQSIAGQVVDAADGRALSGAAVEEVENLGGIFAKSRLRVTPVNVDGDARFQAKSIPQHPIILRVSAPGHSPQLVKAWDGPIGIVPLARIDPDTAGIKSLAPLVWTRDRAAAGNVDFLVELNQDSTDCDLTFRGRYGIENMITIRAQGDGGIQQAADPGRWDRRFLFSLLCTAPIDGYAREVQLPMDSSPAIYFVRTRDGKHYAKFEFEPRRWRWVQYSDGRNPQEGFSLRARANLGGGRGLCDCVPEL